MTPTAAHNLTIFFLLGILNGNDAVDTIKTVLVTGSMITFLWVLFS